MDYSDLRKELLQDLRSEDPEDLRTSFLESVCSELINFDQILDFVPFHFERAARNRRIMDIDGYSFEEDDGTLNVFKCLFSGKEETQTISKADLDKACLRAREFVKNCFDGTVLNSVEDDDADSIDTINTIIQLEQKIQRVKYQIITDGMRTDREIKLSVDDIDEIPGSAILWDVKAYFDLILSKPDREKTIIDFSNFGFEGIRCIKADDIDTENEYDAYLCIMPGKLLSELYTKYGAKLLESNVRSFLSTKKKVNKGIRTTILREPSRFFAYNNGLSTTAVEVLIEKDDRGQFISQITDFQIVNGGQTTAMINALDRSSKDKADLNSVFVPMKLCVIKEAPEEFVPHISEYSNSQNSVSSADFFSNSEFNIKLERISRRLFAPARSDNLTMTKWFYERAAGSYNQEQAFMSAAEKKNFLKTYPKNQKITKTDLAKYRNTYAKLPHIVSKGTSASMAKFVESAKNLWSNGDSPEGIPGARVNDNYFKQSIAIAIIFKDLEKSISNKELAPWYNSGYRANLVTYSIAKMVDVLEQKECSIDLDTIWKNQAINDDLRKQLLIIAEMVLNKINDPDRKVDDVREWCKRLECWTSIQKMDVELIDIRSSIISKKKAYGENKRANRDERAKNEMDAKIEIVTKGEAYWRRLLEWGIEHGELSKDERITVNVACNMESNRRPPSDKQSIMLKKIEKRLIMAGFN